MKFLTRLLTVVALGLSFALVTAQSNELSFVEGTSGVIVQMATSGTFANNALTLEGVGKLTPMIVNTPEEGGSLPVGVFSGMLLTNTVIQSWALAGDLVGTAKLQFFVGTDLYTAEMTLSVPEYAPVLTPDQDIYSFSYDVSDLVITSAFRSNGDEIKSPRMPAAFNSATLSINVTSEFLAGFEAGRQEFLNSGRNGALLNGCAGFC